MKQKPEYALLWWQVYVTLIAVLFALKVVLLWLFGGICQLLCALYTECRLLVLHSRLPFLLRLWDIGRRQRLHVDVLAVGYRPRYGDLFWLYFALICAALAAMTNLYPGGIESISRQYGLLRPQPVTAWLALTSDSTRSPMAQKELRQQIRILHRLNQPILPYLQEMGVNIKDDVEIASALNNVLQQEEYHDRRLPLTFLIRPIQAVRVNPERLSAEWEVEQVKLYLSEDTVLVLTPQQDISGEYKMATILDVVPQKQEYFIVQGTLAALLASGERYSWLIDNARFVALESVVSGDFSMAVESMTVGSVAARRPLRGNIPSGGVAQIMPAPFYPRDFLRSGGLPDSASSGVGYAPGSQRVPLPLYLENLLILLDRSLESKGGLRSGDTLTALYQAPQDQEQPQLQYVEIVTQGSVHRYVYYQPDLDDQGYLYDGGGFAYVPSDWGEPLRSLRVTSRFGLRLHPIKKFTRFHEGIDYGAEAGTPIRATKDGIVLHIRYERTGYGHYVRLLHDDDFSSLYAHMQHVHPDLRHGYPVKKGQVIGYVGNSGLSTGPHLHYEVALNGKVIDPSVVTKPEMRLLSPRQRWEIRQVLMQRQERLWQMQSVN